MSKHLQQVEVEQHKTESNQAFETIRSRRAVRHFSQKKISDELLREILDLTNRTPSGFNLQPWHFVIVNDSSLKKLLSHVSMDQRQVIEAPCTVVFVADPRAWKKSYKEVLKLALDSGSLSKERAKRYRKSVNLLFYTGPFGILGFFKNIAVTLRRFKRPTPNVITSKSEAGNYVVSQTMLAASTFMIAAKAAGLDTSPMEGFDEFRIKKLLSIPSYMRVPVVIALGYAIDVEETPQSIRIPVEKKIHINQFTKKK
jgi:nitroreductase